MGQKLIRTGVELDRQTDLVVEKWAESEGRSKRRHLAILARRLADLLESHRKELERLGLAQRRQPD